MRKRKHLSTDRYKLALFLNTSVYAYDNRIINNAIHNHSSIQLSYAQKIALGRGYNFIPTRNPKSLLSIGTMEKDLETFFRRLRISFHFQNQPQTPRNYPSLYVPNTSWNVPTKDRHPVLEEYIKKTRQSFSSTIKNTSTRSFMNITNSEMKALQDLCHNTKVKIAYADKNLGIVIVDTEFYERQTSLHLQTIDKDHPQANFTILDTKAMLVKSEYIKTSIKQWILEYENIMGLDYKAKLFICSFLPEEISEESLNKLMNRFYLLIKVHKDPLSSRPVIPSHSYITTGLSKFLDKYLQPHVQKQASICKNTIELVHKLDKKLISTSTVLVTLDIENMYPSIPITNDTFNAIEMLLKDVFKISENIVKGLLRAFQIILKNHIVLHQNVYYLQRKGTAIGAPCATVFADTFCLSLEHRFKLRKGTILYTRKIDDIFALIDRRFLDTFLARFKDIEIFKYTVSKSMEEIHFLDLSIYKGPRWKRTNKLDYKLYTKPASTHMHLAYSSNHAPATKKGVIKEAILRRIRYNSSLSTYLEQRDEYIYQLRKRGIPFKFIQDQVKDLYYKDRQTLLQPKESKKDITCVFSTTYYNRDLRQVVSRSLNEHWETLTANPELHTLFLQRPMIVNRSGPNLKYLMTVWSK